MHRISGGFEMSPEINLDRDKNGSTFILQFLVAKKKDDSGQLYLHNPQLLRTEKSQIEDPNNFSIMDY